MVCFKQMGPTPRIWCMQSGGTGLFRNMFRTLSSTISAAAQVRYTMVLRLRAILGIMGCDDGPMDICSAPDVHPTTSIYCSIFWFDWSHSLLFTRIEKPNLDIDLVDSSASMSPMVSHQLFPDGVERSSSCYEFWSQKGSCVDVGLTPEL